MPGLPPLSTREATQPVLRRGLFIGNAWRPARGGEILSIVHPATEQGFGEIANVGEADVDVAVAAARRAFETGHRPRMPLRERANAPLRFNMEGRSKAAAQGFAGPIPSRWAAPGILIR